MNIFKKLKITEEKKFRILLIIAAVLFFILIFTFSNRNNRPRRIEITPDITISASEKQNGSATTEPTNPKNIGKLPNCKHGSCMNKVSSADKKYCDKHSHLEKTN